MRILVALSRFPYPLDKGDKLRAYYQLQGLSKNNEIYLVCLTDQTPAPADMAQVKQFCKHVEVVRLTMIERLLNLVFGLFNGEPFQVNYFRSMRMKKAIQKLLESKKIDVCYVQLIRLIKNIPFSLNTKYYLDYMDAFSEGMTKRYQLSKWYEKPLVKEEAKRLKKYEEQAFYHFSGYSIISETDADVFPLDIRRRIDVIPNGISNSYFDFKNVTREKRYDIIFTGNMGYHPNVQACKFLVNHVLPNIKTKVRVCLAGTEPSREVQALESEYVTVTGYVHDIKDYLSQAKIFVAPLFSGSGLQNKLLESMAMGMPTITTSLANNALKAKNGEQIVVCDNKMAFAQAIENLINNPRVAEQIGKNGRNYIKNTFDWQVSNSLLEKAFKRIIIN